MLMPCLCHLLLVFRILQPLPADVELHRKDLRLGSAALLGDFSGTLHRLNLLVKVLFDFNPQKSLDRRRQFVEVGNQQANGYHRRADAC